MRIIADLREEISRLRTKLAKNSNKEEVVKLQVRARCIFMPA